MEVLYPIRSSPKTSNTYRENVKKEALERKKNIIHLIFKYLIENNLHSVAEILQNETQAGIYYEVCDNVDLEIVLQEYQSYYHTKFQKHPKILRKITESGPQNLKKDNKRSAFKGKPSESSMSVEKSEEDFKFEIMSLSKETGVNKFENPSLEMANHSSEWKEMANQIIKQIVPKNLGTTFKDCISLNGTIETLREAVIYPFTYPQLFEKACNWKGVLLYGPPGTGKTLLAKALACETPYTFINVTSSTFISKWRGESEKMVKVLFEVAKIYSPATIFIDEIDALASTTQDSHHEASRRFKSELLVQIDGIIKTEEVFVIASTNNPWSVDNALLRRFEKRILVSLPDKESRTEIFQYYFSKNSRAFKQEEIQRFVEISENFSGSDIKNVCKESEMIVVREKLQQIKKGTHKHLVTREIKSSDVISAIKKIKPCIDHNNYKKYVEWGNKYGAT